MAGNVATHVSTPRDSTNSAFRSSTNRFSVFNPTVSSSPPAFVPIRVKLILLLLSLLLVCGLLVLVENWQGFQSQSAMWQSALLVSDILPGVFNATSTHDSEVLSSLSEGKAGSGGVSTNVENKTLHWRRWRWRKRAGAGNVSALSPPPPSLVDLAHRDVWMEDAFDVKKAGKLWDEQVGCDSFRARHADLISAYGNGGPKTWPRDPNLQDWNDPPCQKLKLKHVVVLVKERDWMTPNWLDGFHSCTRCGITCQFTWSSTMADQPDADIYVDGRHPPETREPGEPLSVYMNLEPVLWQRIREKADLGIGFAPETDVQTTYARPRESWQHHRSRRKRQDVLLFRATSNCGVKWRNWLAQRITSQLAAHSFGRCDNNVGGQGQEGVLYPQCIAGEGSKIGAKVSHCTMSHYKFVLAIENTRLPSYVSEKMFIPLDSGTVPVYFGSPNAASFVPPESFIAGDSFNSTEALVDFLVNMDPVTYMGYFAWRRCGVMGHLERTRALSMDTLPCRLCEKVSTFGKRSSASTS
eukprot:TRINITY_DN13473_c0_g1_i1.p1 TRINITY_DN13473_c0_g1~~TRINITY_DN13473_c0_g1_i1.p1  ORF type:complete len:540 (+),score=46.79 TRINITY_DN13473_c0_g1_i1:46-1620(+)